MLVILRQAQFSEDMSGATLVEYGLALVLTVALGGVGLTQIAGQTNDSLATAQSTLPAYQFAD